MNLFTRNGFLALALAMVVMPAFSQWNSNTGVNNVIVNSNNEEFSEISVSDGANGTIIFISDYTTNADIFVRKIAVSGITAWGTAANPVPICVTTEDKYELNAIPDGAGGAYIAWSDYRNDPDNGDIYIQRVNSAGIVQWGTNGLRVTTDIPSDDLQPILCSDGAGGVIVAWYGDDDTNDQLQSFAQRYNSTGTALWATNGVQVCTAPGFRGANGIATDGNNGAIIFFLDSRNDPNGFDYDYLTENDSVNFDIYGQRLDASGQRLWSDDGAAIVNAPGFQGFGLAVPDGSGGAIFTFDDSRNDDTDFTNNDIFSQRVNSSGTPLWGIGGVAVCTAPGNQYIIDAIPDGAGGVVAALEYLDINKVYAQRITGTGIASWVANGVEITPLQNEVYDAAITMDGSGNTIVAYTVSDSDSSSVRAQKINASGVLQWPSSGVIIADPGQAFPNKPTIVMSDSGSAIIAWTDSRSSTFSNDVYASKVLANGTLAGINIANYITVANGNWDNPAIWSGGFVPPAGAIVIVRHAVAGNITTSCTSLKVQQPAGNLTVLNGVNITITN